MGHADYSVIKQRPYISHKSGLVQEVNDMFLLMSNYGREELIGKNILFVLNNLLKLNKRVESADMPIFIGDCFFFNKFMDFKEASVEVHQTKDSELFYVTFTQQPLISVNNPISYTQQLLYDNLTGIAIYNAEDFTLLKANKEYERIIYNRSKQSDIVGKKIHEFYNGWQNSKAMMTWEEAIKTKKTTVSLENKIVNPISGAVEYFDASVTPILEGDRVKFLVVSVNNITDKIIYKQENEKKAKLIGKQKELLEAVIEKQKDAIYIIDKDYNVLVSNAATKERYGIEQINSVADIHRVAEFYDENNKALRFEQLPAYLLINGEEVNDLKVKMKQGDQVKHLNLNGSSIFNEEGAIEHAFLCGTDITEVVESKQQLLEQKDQLEAIMNSMSDALFIIDKEYRFIMKNNAALKLFEKEPKVLSDTFENVKYFSLSGREVSIDNTPVHNMLKGESVYDRVALIRSDNKEMYVSINANPIFDDDGSVKMGVIAIRDITDYMRNEILIRTQQQALLQAEKKEKENLEKLIVMKDEFLSLVSHEFKTPLTVINSALQAMEFLYKDQITDNIRNYLNKIKQNTFRQVRLVNNLLDITGANAGHIKLNMKNRDIVFVTRSMIESVSVYANQKGVKLHFSTDLEQKEIALDEEKFERVILNLLSNAIKFTPKDKSITVFLKFEAEKAVIIVKDEGIGIPEEKHELIFERFGQVDSCYTRQAEGSGIGLSLVRLMVNAMGGAIRVESKVGDGSSFIVELPDRLEKEEPTGEALKQLIDTRLVQSIEIEFSDIYF